MQHFGADFHKLKVSVERLVKSTVNKFKDLVVILLKTATSEKQGN